MSELSFLHLLIIFVFLKKKGAKQIPPVTYSFVRDNWGGRKWDYWMASAACPDTEQLENSGTIHEHQWCVQQYYHGDFQGNREIKMLTIAPVNVPGLLSVQYFYSEPFTHWGREKSVRPWSELLFFRFFFSHPIGIFFIIVDEILFFQ